MHVMIARIACGKLLALRFIGKLIEAAYKMPVRPN